MFLELAQSSTPEMENTNYFFGYFGIAIALVFASIYFLTLDLGSAYGTAKSGVGITSMGVLRPDLIIKSVVPVVMAGILGIYGLIISVIINQKIGSSNAGNYSPKMGFSQLAAGLCNGLSSLVSY